MEIFTTYGIYFALGFLASGPVGGFMVARFLESYLAFYATLIAFGTIFLHTALAYPLIYSGQNLTVALFGLLTGFSLILLMLSRLKDN